MSASGGDPAKPALGAWGSRATEIRPAASERPEHAGPEVDRALVEERMALYCWAYDERRRELLESCFLPDAVWDGSVGGEVAVGPMVGRERIVSWLTEFWPHQLDQRRHMLLNPLVTLDGEAAELLTYLVLTSAAEGKVTLETTGFYRARMRLTAGCWRIAHLFGGFDCPFWPGRREELSDPAKRRHGI